MWKKVDMLVGFAYLWENGITENNIVGCKLVKRQSTIMWCLENGYDRSIAKVVNFELASGKNNNALLVNFFPLASLDICGCNDTFCVKSEPYPKKKRKEKKS